MNYALTTVRAAWRNPSLLATLKLEDLDPDLLVSAVGALAQSSIETPAFFSHFSALELRGHPKLSPYRQVFDSVEFSSVSRTVRSVATNCYKVFLRTPKPVMLQLSLTHKVQLLVHLSKMQHQDALIEKYADELVRATTCVSVSEATQLLVSLPRSSQHLAVRALAEMCAAVVINQCSADWPLLMTLPETEFVRALAELHQG
jgi:hypothetical protein